MARQPRSAPGNDTVMVDGMDDMVPRQGRTSARNNEADDDIDISHLKNQPLGPERGASVDERSEERDLMDVRVEPEDDTAPPRRQEKPRERERLRDEYEDDAPPRRREDRDGRYEAVDEDDEEDARLAYDEAMDDGDKRSSRRARRNRARREASRAADEQIARLTQQVDVQSRYIAGLTNGHIGLAINTIDGQIATLRGNLAHIDREISRAVSEHDGAAFEAAQRLRDETNARLFQMDAARQRLVHDAQTAQRAQPQGPQTPSVQQRLDPAAIRLSEKFMERNPWFDPRGGDEDSRLAGAIDDAIAEEGYNPATPMYWREFERRLRARGIGVASDDENGDDDDDDTSRKRTPARRRAGPPVNGARGHRTSGAPTVRLHPDMVEYLEGEGLLDANLSKDQIARKNRLLKAWSAGNERLSRESRR